jgi:hypothetical protein
MLALLGRGSSVPGYAGSEPPGGAMEAAITPPAVTGQQDGHDEQLFAHYSTTMHYLDDPAELDQLLELACLGTPGRVGVGGGMHEYPPQRV